MQNEPNFPDDPMNVNKVLTKDYENKSNWTLGQNKPNTKPIKANSKPISPPHAAKQTQYKPKTNPIKPNFRGKKMLLRMTFNGRRVSFGYYADEIEAAKACDKKAKELSGEFACPNFPERMELKKWIRKIVGGR